MSRLVIALLITLLAYPAFAADAPKTEENKAPKSISASQGGSIMHKLSPENQRYYDKAAAEEGTVQTRSGLLYKSLKEGSGASPGELSTVTVNYRATLINNREFNSTYKRKMSEKHRMNAVFRCWQEGLLKMKVGGKAKLVCPPELAFAGRGVPNIVPKDAVVTYEIELLEVKK